MVDANETVSETLKREFGEETVNSLKMTSEQKENLEKQISQIFSGGFEVKNVKFFYFGNSFAMKQRS